MGWGTDPSVYRHFGPKTLQTFQKSDLGHFGMSEVSRHFCTGAEVSFGHFSTILAGLDSLVVTAKFLCNSHILL